MKLDTDAIDKTLSFELYSQVKYSNMKFTDIISASTMLALGQDPQAAHIQNLPFLTNVSDDYRQIKYGMFINADNEKVYLGLPWIKEDSVVENDSPVYQITFKQLTQAQLDSVRSMLTASGIEDFTIATL